MIVIIDYGMGNLRSVQKAFKRINADAVVSADIEVIKKADRLVLPGVGHFKNGMENLKKLNVIDILHEKVIQEKVPVLGICLGMQLFTKHSEEGDVDGFGWINAKTVKFNFTDAGNRLKVPHMGWNSIRMTKNTPIFKGIDPEGSFYFVHSYFVRCECEEDIASTTDYGNGFISSVIRGNIIGTQFHPEKSHGNGLKIIENFAAYV